MPTRLTWVPALTKYDVDDILPGEQNLTGSNEPNNTSQEVCDCITKGITKGHNNGPVMKMFTVKGNETLHFANKTEFDEFKYAGKSFLLPLSYSDHMAGLLYLVHSFLRRHSKQWPDVLHVLASTAPLSIYVVECSMLAGRGGKPKKRASDSA